MPVFYAVREKTVSSVFSGCGNGTGVLSAGSVVRLFMNGAGNMRKIINEAGKEAIGAFVRENLSGRVGDETVKSYIDMAESQMVIHGGLPCLEISMCFSLTGMTEYLELDADEVSYEDCVFDSAEALAGIFGADTAARLAGAVYEKRMTESGERHEAMVTVSHDGYRFSVTAVRMSPDGDANFYEVKCLGPDNRKTEYETA